jgi:hypothetical protein
MRSVLLDNSFCLRLVNEADEFHENVKGYFKYFLENDITMYLSSITFAEYCVANDARDFPLAQVKTLNFDMRDAVKAGKIWEFVHYQRLAKEADRKRDTIKDDCKLFAQICNRQIDAFISKDKKAYSQYVEPIGGNPDLSCKFEFIDLTIPPQNYFQEQGSLFT